MKRWLYIFALLLSVLPTAAKTTSKKSKLPERPNPAVCWIYRTSEWVDHYLTQGLDTDYITLPEHSWRLALTNGMEGIYSNWTVNRPDLGDITLRSHSTPSIDLGFQMGYRSFGFGYSWDLLHAYSQKLSLSLGSKYIGLDLSRQTSANIRGNIQFENAPKSDINPFTLPDNLLWITNTNVSLWYALNSAHYSHQAAIKQSYIQKRSAGSLLLSLSYMSSNIAMQDSSMINGTPLLAMLMDNMRSMNTHQVAVGLGYGFNYTPNGGKLLVHLSANAQLVCYSINQISMGRTDSAWHLGVPMYDIQPEHPVHVTGNMRAAVSWEINPWVHMSGMVQANNLRFTAKEGEMSAVSLNNWYWQARVSVGVRLGAGKKRVQQVLDDEEEYLLAEEKEILRQAKRHRRDTTLRAQAREIEAEHAYADSVAKAELNEVKASAKETAAMSAKRKHRMRHTKLPEWITDYFYSPRQ